MWEPGEEQKAYLGFTIEDYHPPLGEKLVIHSFLKGWEQFTEVEVIKSQQVANERIHVKQMIQQLKCFRIFNRVTPLQMIDLLNRIIDKGA